MGIVNGSVVDAEVWVSHSIKEWRGAKGKRLLKKCVDVGQRSVYMK